MKLIICAACWAVTTSNWLAWKVAVLVTVPANRLKFVIVTDPATVLMLRLLELAADTIPAVVNVPIVTLLSVPEPFEESSLAWIKPESLPTVKLVIVPTPAAVMEPELLVIDMPEMEPPETLPELVPMVLLLILPEPGLVSSTAVMEPELLPTLIFEIVPCPAEVIEPELLVIDMPEIEPPETLPELVPMVLLLIVPEPGLVSSTAVMEPELLPTLMFEIVPCPAAVIEPELLVIDIPEIEPPETLPELVPIVLLLIFPEPGLVSSTAVMDPLLLPTLMFEIVPCPAAVMEPELLVIDMPEIEPPETLPELVPMVLLLIVPEPGLVSSTAVMEPLLLPTLMFEIVP